jgi:hypothetical protein
MSDKEPRKVERVGVAMLNERRRRDVAMVRVNVKTTEEEEEEEEEE